MEEPCLAETGNYDHVYYDEVTGVAFPTKLCEEAVQLDVEYMEMDVYTPCENETVMELGLTRIGTRWLFTNKGDTERPLIRARRVAQETKKTTKMDLTDTFMTFSATSHVEGFRFLLARAMKKRSVQDEMVIGVFDISRPHFHSPVRRKVAIRVPQADALCPSVALLDRAMYGTKDAAPHFDSYCERTMEQIGHHIGLFNPCLHKHGQRHQGL